MAVVRLASSTANTLARATGARSSSPILAAVRATGHSARGSSGPAPRCFGNFRKLFGGSSNGSGSEKKLKVRRWDALALLGAGFAACCAYDAI